MTKSTAYDTYETIWFGEHHILGKMHIRPPLDFVDSCNQVASRQTIH